MKTKILAERVTLFQDMISSAGSGNNHVDRQIIKIMEDNRALANKENGEKLTKYWQLSYHVASVLMLLVEQTKDLYNKMGRHAPKPETMLLNVIKDLDKYFEHTNGIIQLDSKGRMSEALTEDEKVIERNRISNDFTKIYNDLMKFAGMKDEVLRHSVYTQPRKPRVWTDEKIEELRELFLDNTITECAKIMGMTVSQVRNAIRRFDLSNDNAKKRQEDAIRKLCDDKEVREVGHEYIGTRGYVFLKTENGWVAKHRYTWEKHNGKLSSNEIIRFKDNDKTNCDVSNLYIINRNEQVKENSFNRYPNDVRKAINNVGKLKRTIKKIEDK